MATLGAKRGRPAGKKNGAAVVEEVQVPVGHGAEGNGSRKKVAAAPPAPQPTNGAGPVVIDGMLHFSPYDFARFELVQHKVANLRQGIALKRSEQITLQHGYEVTMRKLREEEVQIEALLRVREQEWKQLRDELQVLYKLNFDDLTYDDITGLLKVHGELVPSSDAASGVPGDQAS